MVTALFISVDAKVQPRRAAVVPDNRKQFIEESSLLTFTNFSVHPGKTKAFKAGLTAPRPESFEVHGPDPFTTVSTATG